MVLYVVLVGVVWRRERQPPAIGELTETLDEDNADEDTERAAVGLALAVGGIAIMASGGAFAVQGAERVVAVLSATDTAVGLTLVALATTAELLALVWAAACREISELAVAAIVGSATYNATATLGAAALVYPSGDIDVRTAALAAAALPVVILVASRNRTLGRGFGVALVAVYVVFVVAALR